MIAKIKYDREDLDNEVINVDSNAEERESINEGTNYLIKKPSILQKKFEVVEVLNTLLLMRLETSEEYKEVHDKK